VNTAEPPYDRKPGDAPALSDEETGDVIALLRALTDGCAATELSIRFRLRSDTHRQYVLHVNQGASMKRLAILSLFATAVVGLHAETYIDHARVRGVDPQYESVSVPREECSSRWVQETRRAGGREYGGAVIGGVAGALLGNQVGKGHGREAATAVGAVVGAFAGDRIANRDQWDRYEEAPREVMTCRTVSDVQSRIAGYRVNYEYRGQQFTTLMRENPGRTLQVRVSVDPVGQ
jgi:uncharacterized protein YcfJ